MNGPPSLRCQCGAGSLRRSTLRPRIEFSMNAALATSTGFCGVSVWRLRIQAFSASSGFKVGSRPSASAARCGVVVALVKTRTTGLIALDAVEQQRRAFRGARRDLGDAAELELRIGAMHAPQRAKLVHLLDEAAQILVHHECPPHCRPSLSHGATHALHRRVLPFQPEALFRCADRVAGRAEGHRQAGARHSGAVRPRSAAEGGRSVSRLHPGAVARPADARPAVGAGQDAGDGEARQRRARPRWWPSIRTASSAIRRWCR